MKSCSIFGFREFIASGRFIATVAVLSEYVTKTVPAGDVDSILNLFPPLSFYESII
jgi:hypothetical protein